MAATAFFKKKKKYGGKGRGSRGCRGMEKVDGKGFKERMDGRKI